MNGDTIVPWFFDGWGGPARVALVGTSAYLAMVLLMRITGNRTLSKMNAFDFVVTVALGSTLATILLSKQTALVEGITALALLIALQWLITWLATRSDRVAGLIKSEPVLLVRDGRLLRGAMRGARVIEADILQAVRQGGAGSMEQVAAVVLETDGSFSVIPGPIDGEPSAMTNVDRDPVARRS
ncbi:DUF421 domain-containing protein [Tautonia plasticadhaerens]|uniref:DUF421 domain-containing protein n=1 Tax=Tautonia plasticadhaerens TaxID=2527974 RepID=A0A518H0F6_9BACT|nr:YetF domain-containing protein [Tautonia plasticadhaerens]QDV34326.1 hypothetical protein ElP_22110 [Tautonia plasticadhaerens]